MTESADDPTAGENKELPTETLQPPPLEKNADDTESKEPDKSEPKSLADEMKKGYDLLLPPWKPEANGSGKDPAPLSPILLPKFGFRFVILAITTFALTMTLANGLVFNFVIVCIVPKVVANFSLDGQSGQCCPRKYECYWSLGQQTTFLAAPGWGMAMAILPVSLLMQKLGPRLTFLLAALPSAIATILSPYAILSNNMELFLCFRIIQGFGYCVCPPLMAAMTSRWAANGEAGRFTGIASCCFQIAAILTMPLSGLSCTSRFDWPLAYYLIGGLSMGGVLLWVAIFRDSPLDHPLMSRDEAYFVLRGKASSHRSSVKRRIPYLEIFRSPAFWAIIIARMGDQFAYQLISMYMPTYLKRVMNFDLRATGFTSALPTVAQAGVKLSVGFVSDSKCCHDETVKVRTFNSIAFIGAAGFYIALSFLQSTNEAIAALVLFSLALGCLGFNTGGWLKSVSVVSQVYSGFVMGIALSADCFVALVLPFIVGPLTPHQRFSEWRFVFLVIAAIVFVCNLCFCISGSGQPADWTHGDRSFSGGDNQKIDIQELGRSHPSDSEDDEDNGF